jgi:hypothetical protein
MASFENIIIFGITVLSVPACIHEITRIAVPFTLHLGMRSFFFLVFERMMFVSVSVYAAIHCPILAKRDESRRMECRFWLSAGSHIAMPHAAY